MEAKVAAGDTVSHRAGGGRVRGKADETHGANVGAEPRSWTTPAVPTVPEDWTKPEERMRPGSWAGTLKEKDFQMGTEHPDRRAGPA